MQAVHRVGAGAQRGGRGGVGPTTGCMWHVALGQIYVKWQTLELVA